MRSIAAALLAIAVIAGAAARAHAQDAAAEARGLGEIVTAIEYDVPAWMPDNEIRRVTRIKKGKALARWRVASTVRRIHLLGYVDNVVVKTEPHKDGVKVVIKIYARYQVRDIVVKGNRTLNDLEIIEDVLRLKPGSDFRPEDIAIYEGMVRDAMADVGHLKATVKIAAEQTPRDIDNKVDIAVEVNERPTYHVETIVLSGDLAPYTREKILRVLRWKDGMAYEKERVDTGLERLKNWLKTRQHYEARVGDIDTEDETTVKIDHDHSSMTFFIRVDVGPRIETIYPSDCYTCAQKKWKLNNHLDVKNNRRFTRYVVEPFAEKIEDYYRRKGYLDVDVTGDFEEALDEDGEKVKRLVFRMDRGKKYKIEEIDFKNNDNYEDPDLKDELDARKYFLPEDFNKSLENVIAHYNRNGFIQAKILGKSATIDEGTGEVFIEIVVDEGPRALIESVDLSGNEVLDDTVFRNMLEQAELIPGYPYNPFLVAETKTRMIAKYLTRGYLKARIRERIQISEDGTRVQVTYEFTEGRQYFFGNVYVHGNKLTKSHVIKRELFITSGDPFNYEDVFQSQQQLMKLGFFNKVEIEPVDPDIDEEYIDLIVDVDERNAGYIKAGVGYNTYFGYQAATEIGHKNLAGHGRSLSFRTEVGFREETFEFEQRTATIVFGWPWIARLPMDGELSIVDDQRRQIGYDLRELATTAAVKVEFPKLFYNLKATRHNEGIRELSRHWSGRLAYAYIRDFLYNIDEDVDDQEPGEVKIATISPQLTRDSRDNAFMPTTGKVYMAMLEWGSPPLLSEINYLKAIGQFSYYLPVFRWFDKHAKNGVVFAQNFKVGHAQELRETDTLPINRRFYLGGSSTIRGFGQDEIAPKADDERTPIGGYFMAYSNTEFRIPIGDTNFGILAFFDAGNVSSEFKTWYIDKVRTTTGLGFRYLTPVGPISADYGFKLNREPHESYGEFYITVGNAF
ncbi:outer membrane protein assembly factor BamA [bacterium]|nr:outer membrane protein assembly factor BamA [bacterium]